MNELNELLSQLTELLKRLTDFLDKIEYIALKRTKK